MNQINILNCTLQELKLNLQKIKLEPFLAAQIFDWVYKKQKFEFTEMKNISVLNQAKLVDHFNINIFKNIQKIEAQNKLAVKYIFELYDNNFIEAVLLKEKEYYTLCVSSQVGCPLKCQFCKTGYSGFKRNLDVAEILLQILHVLKDGYKVSHIVFMGMGEPLLNYQNVMKAIDLITDEKALNISKRKIVISTSGIISALKKIIAEKRVLNLAFSVGITNPQKRKVLMPVENTNPIHHVISLLKEYGEICNRQITLEYTLIRDKNDSKLDLDELINLSKFLKAKVNLIEFNPISEVEFQSLDKKKMLDLKNYLIKSGVPVTIRFKKGQGINAACGQLGQSSIL